MLSGSRDRLRLDPDPGSTASPSPDPLVDAPLFVRDALPQYYGGRNENVAPNERRRSAFGSGASTTASSDSEGVNAGGVVRFGIPK